MGILACKLTVRVVEEDERGSQDHYVWSVRTVVLITYVDFQVLLLLMTARFLLA